MNTPTAQSAHKTLASLAKIIGQMASIADDRLSQMAGEASDEAAIDALLIATYDIDEKMDALRGLLTRAYSIADEQGKTK